jgi:DNA-binding MarR family transcriptional regulator
MHHAHIVHAKQACIDHYMRTAYEWVVQSSTITNVLGAFAQAIVDAVETGVESTDLSPASAAALVHLSKYEGARISELRVPLELSHPGCVRLVDRLEVLRLVTRGAADDGRAVALHLTARGSAAARSTLRRRGEALESVLSALTARERAELGRLAAKVLTRLVRSEPQALQTCRLCDYAACPDDVCPVGQALAHGAREGR